MGQGSKDFGCRNSTIGPGEGAEDLHFLCVLCTDCPLCPHSEKAPHPSSALGLVCVCPFSFLLRLACWVPGHRAQGQCAGSKLGAELCLSAPDQGLPQHGHCQCVLLRVPERLASSFPVWTQYRHRLFLPFTLLRT